MRLFRPFTANGQTVRLEGEQVCLRPPAERDWRSYAEIRAASRRFLEPWEPTWPADALSRDAFFRRLSRYAADWRADSGYSFFLFEAGGSEVIGGISMSNVRRGVAQCGTLGYWIGESYSRRGYMSEALTLVIDFAFTELALHRLEAACLPSNTPSQRLLMRCGFSQDGYARKYLKIGGVWHDHLLFSLLAEDRARARCGGAGR